MPKTKLTSAAAARLKCPEKGQVEHFDELLPSFGLRLSYSGTKSWFVMSRVNGKLFRMTLGKFPAVSLAKAREQARNIIATAQAGIDPRALLQSEKEKDAERRRNTFNVMAEEFLIKHVGTKLRPSTAREYRRILKGDDTNKLRNIPITEITKRDILNVIECIQERGSPGAADRALAYLKKFFNWCADREVIEFPPTDRIRLSSPRNQRERVLTDQEIKTIWDAFAAEGGLFGPLFQLLLLTGQRRGEVAGMRWDELVGLNGKRPAWELPGERTKNHRPHIVPLSLGALRIINSIAPNGTFLFSTTGRTPVSGLGKAKARIDEWITEHHTPLPHWTLHDLRRTMVTKMNEDLRIPPHVVEAVVNHMSGSAKRGVAGVYNRALYLDERRSALEAWSNWLLMRTGQPAVDNVLDLHEGPRRG